MATRRPIEVSRQPKCHRVADGMIPAEYAESSPREASPDVHSWGAQGRALIERIKARQVDSTTSESMDSRISTIDSSKLSSLPTGRR